MNFESMPKTEKENGLDEYFNKAKKALLDKTLERINLAPDSRKIEALEDALNFYGYLHSLDKILDIPHMDHDVLQESISKLAQQAGLDPEIVSVADYVELIKEADEK